MFDYTRKLQLALTDRLRRAGLSAGAGVALLIGAGFLLAALWTWLADHLGWGALGASLAIGLGFVLVGLAVMLMARKERHPVPTTDELKAEVEQRLMLAADMAVEKATGAADAALERASQKAGQLIDQAEQRVHSLTDSLAYKADRMADRAEASVYGAARRAGESAVGTLGLPPDTLRRVAGQVQGASQSRAAAVAPLIGAFAVGMTLASRLQHWRHRDEPDWEEAEDWSEDPY
ncbi:phage holin family protein [Paracoccus sp. AS002]|uniref:phage holin family protein n=1 Tax=Paracoccus sp. AS002 TaxID=3019545 RepID=UPI0023E8ACED|nr:phage holin family protein [Paracoccus sp. AS002]MDF3905463.1 phage holin family protein [Paracoccus sp. AS002]